MPGKLILFPNVLEESLPSDSFLPASVARAAALLQGMVVESEKAARRYLRRFLTHEQMAAIPLRLLNEHTPAKEIQALLEPMIRGETWGLVSDAGLACIADPGSDLVWLAQQAGISVESFTGPCSLVLALQLSGFSGQQFAFHGYLPREEEVLERAICALERNAKGTTQMWIEAPYRSAKMLDLLKRVLQPSTRLCVCSQLTSPSERVLTRFVRDWKTIDFPMGKEPAVFLIFA